MRKGIKRQETGIRKRNKKKETIFNRNFIGFAVIGSAESSISREFICRRHEAGIGCRFTNLGVEY